MTELGDLFGEALALPDVVPLPAITAMRDRLVRRGYTRYALLDRGSYDIVPDVAEPVLFETLGSLARETLGFTLTVTAARAIRLGPGDYLLAHHDRPHADRSFELVLELSPRPVAGAELHYRRRGQVYFRFPCVPGSLAIVERTPAVTSNHTYVSKRDATTSVVRLVVQAERAR